MVIVNFIGHGFQWWQGNNPNPAPFVVPENCEIRFYIQQAGDGGNGLYDANDTVPIIREELVAEEGGEHLVQTFHPGDNCPEHFLITDPRNWDDIYENQVRGEGPYAYMARNQWLGINGFPPLTIREFGPQENRPSRFLQTRQFACSPGRDSIFALSWLANHIRELLTNQPLFEIGINIHEPIVLRWLVCREIAHANNIENIPEVIHVEADENVILVR